jgi:hypothetical protein
MKYKPSLFPKKVALRPHHPRKPAAPFVFRQSKLFGGRIARPNKAPIYAARRKALFGGASSLDELAQLLSKKIRVKGPKKARVFQRADPAMTLQKRKAAYIKRYGEPRYAPTADAIASAVEARIGHYAKPRKRRVGSMVAMNPAFGNPAFDFSFSTMSRNTISGLQTGIGVGLGVAGAKYGNQFLVSKIAKDVLKQDDAGLLGRLASGLLSGIVLGTLSRSFIPGEWGEKIADGIFGGSMVYVAGGILGSNKLPIIAIGSMINDQVGDYAATPIVQSPMQQLVNQAVAAYGATPYDPRATDVAEAMMDDMSTESEVSKGW